MLAAYQTSSAIKMMDKPQIEQCADSMTSLLEDFRTNSIQAKLMKRQMTMRNVVSFLMFEILRMQKEGIDMNMCALKALKPSENFYDMDTLNIAVTNSQNFIRDLGKFQQLLNNRVHEKQYETLWQSYRSKYFSGKYQLNKEVFQTEQKVLRIDYDKMITTSDCFTKFYQKLLIANRSTAQEQDMWYYMLSTIASLNEIRQYMS